MLARLQEELSRWTYSLQGLLAVMRPYSGQVCQSLIVLSYWMPGSAQSQAACAIVRNSFLASQLPITSPPDSRQLAILSIAQPDDCLPVDKELHPNFICGQLPAEELSIKFLEQRSKPI